MDKIRCEFIWKYGNILFWEISLIFFCPRNLGKDLRTIIKKKALSEKKCILISLSQHFTILHLNNFKIDNLSWLLRFKLNSGWQGVFCLYVYICICRVCEKFLQLRYTSQKGKVKPKYKTKEKWNTKQRNVLSLSFKLC